MNINSVMRGEYDNFNNSNKYEYNDKGKKSNKEKNKLK